MDNIKKKPGGPNLLSPAELNIMDKYSQQLDAGAISLQSGSSSGISLQSQPVGYSIMPVIQQQANMD